MIHHAALLPFGFSTKLKMHIRNQKEIKIVTLLRVNSGWRTWLRSKAKMGHLIPFPLTLCTHPVTAEELQAFPTLGHQDTTSYLETRSQKEPDTLPPMRLAVWLSKNRTICEKGTFRHQPCPLVAGRPSLISPITELFTCQNKSE